MQSAISAIHEFSAAFFYYFSNAYHCLDDNIFFSCFHCFVLRLSSSYSCMDDRNYCFKTDTYPRNSDLDLPTSGTDQSSSPSSLHTKEPCASVSPGLTLNQGSANVLMSETAYLATVGSLVGVLILGMITAVIYCFNLRDCKR